MPVQLWIRYGNTKEETEQSAWKKSGVYADERRAKDNIASQRAVLAKMGIKYSEFDITEKDEEPDA